jgi:uncharacterized C2H2 Zn-finger protein
MPTETTQKDDRETSQEGEQALNEHERPTSEPTELGKASKMNEEPSMVDQRGSSEKIDSVEMPALADKPVDQGGFPSETERQADIANDSEATALKDASEASPDQEKAAVANVENGEDVKEPMPKQGKSSQPNAKVDDAPAEKENEVKSGIMADEPVSKGASVKVRDSAKAFKCSECSRSFHTQGLLSKHRSLLHGEAEEMECEECEAMFKRRIRLVQHWRSADHTGTT